MSYLGFPRLNFSGKFQADPSTVNNDPSHFNTATYVPNDQKPEQLPKPGGGYYYPNGWWNPLGTGYFRLRDCAVNSVNYKDGSYVATPDQDPVIGMSINGANTRVGGKIVDLDSEQQMVSELWGFEIHLGEISEDNGFASTYEVAAFSDIWVRFLAGHPDSFFSAVYQSILSSINWSDTITSRFLKELTNNGRNKPPKLSIKFTVDGLNQDDTSPDFTWGRIVGSIGPYEKDEPQQFVPARYIRPLTDAPANQVMNFAPCRIDEKNNWLFLDLGNSLQTTSAGGPTLDYGPLELVVQEGKGPQATYHTIGYPNYLEPGFYENQAGIAMFDLSLLDKKVQNLVKKNPLGIRTYDASSNTYSMLMSENEEGLFLRADQFVYRLNVGDKPKAEIYATRFGQPVPNQKIDIAYNNSPMEGQVKQGAIAGPPVGIPADALVFKDSITTDKNGKATLQITGKDPHNPRGYIDGQVYGIGYTWPGIPPAVYNANSTNLISLLLWNKYDIPKRPTWVRDVQPILVQYAELYPVMKSVLDLGNFTSCVKHKEALKLVFSKPMTDANYMPVTRDLSENKRLMLLKWLDDPVYIDIETKEDLMQALQIAIELEHATIPPYITAYFSIKPGYNEQVSELIRSVVMEEMLHMSLACNLLNAIGGSPVIDKPGFVPAFPTGLPGSLRPGLTVHIRKCSIAQIEDVFMGIEEPGETIEPKEDHEMTIGWFYHLIKKGFEKLNRRLGKDKLFSGDPSRQLTHWHGTGDMIEVHNLRSAKEAIKEIVEEGEGASPFDPRDGYGELAHFYKFEEIVRGRQIRIHKGKKKKYSFTGPKIPFDPDGVYNMTDDPGMVAIPPNSPALVHSQEFDVTYTHLLRSLHNTFNGSPHELAQAIGLMFSLTVQARRLMQTPIEPGGDVMAGPGFRYAG